MLVRTNRLKEIDTILYHPSSPPDEHICAKHFYVIKLIRMNNTQKHSRQSAAEVKANNKNKAEVFSKYTRKFSCAERIMTCLIRYTDTGTAAYIVQTAHIYRGTTTLITHGMVCGTYVQHNDVRTQNKLWCLLCRFIRLIRRCCSCVSCWLVCSWADKMCCVNRSWLLSNAHSLTRTNLARNGQTRAQSLCPFYRAY